MAAGILQWQFERLQHFQLPTILLCKLTSLHKTNTFVCTIAYLNSPSYTDIAIMFVNCVYKVSHTGIAFCQDEYTVRSSSQLKYTHSSLFGMKKRTKISLPDAALFI